MPVHTKRAQSSTDPMIDEHFPYGNFQYSNYQHSNAPNEKEQYGFHSVFQLQHPKISVHQTPPVLSVPKQVHTEVIQNPDPTVEKPIYLYIVEVSDSADGACQKSF